MRRKERHRGSSTHSQTFIFSGTLQPSGATVNSPVPLRVLQGGSLHDVFLCRCGLHFSRYNTSILQTSRDTCSGQGLTLTVASATGKLCCWMIQFLIATFYAPSDSQFLPLKKYQGTMSSKPLPKIWARGQRRRCGGRARQAKHRPLRLCFFFLSQVLSES